MTREEAIKELQESLDTLREYDIAHSSRLKQALEMAIKALSQEQKSGKWIVDSPHYICSECNYVHHLQRFEVMSGCKLGNYCPNCGAKMESEVNNG